MIRIKYRYLKTTFWWFRSGLLYDFKVMLYLMWYLTLRIFKQVKICSIPRKSYLCQSSFVKINLYVIRGSSGRHERWKFELKAREVWEKSVSLVSVFRSLFRSQSKIFTKIKIHSLNAPMALEFPLKIQGNFLL